MYLSNYYSFVGKLYDKVPEGSVSATLLLGKGFHLKTPDVEQTRAALHQFTTDYRRTGWTKPVIDAVLNRSVYRSPKTVRDNGILLFKRAEVNEESIGSVSYTRARSRINFYINVIFNRVPQMAKVLHFLRVPHPTDPNMEPLRLAMCTFYQPVPQLLGGRTLRADSRLISDAYYAVDPATIHNKMIVAFKGGLETAREVHGMEYLHLTGTR